MRAQIRLPLISSLVVLLVLSGAIAACGGPPAATSSTAVPDAAAPTAGAAAAAPEPTTALVAGSGERVPVEMWVDIANDLDLKAYQTGVDAFNKSQDKIDLKIVKGQGNDAFLTAVTGNNAPDIYITFDGSEPLGTWAQSGLLMPFDDLIAQDKFDMSQILKPSVDLGRYDGKLYGMPWQFDTLLLFYNRHHFTEAGLDPDKPPQTMSDLYAAAKKLTKYDANNNITRLGFMPPKGSMAWYSWIAMFDGQVYDETNKKVTADNPGMLAAMDSLKEAWNLYGDPARVDTFASGLGGGLTPDDPFLKGQVSMTIDGDWRIGYQLRYTKNEYGKDYGVTTIPYPNGKPEKAGTSAFFGMLFVVPHNAPHPREAWEAIKYFQDYKLGVLVTQTMYNLPQQSAALQDKQLLEIPGFAVPLNNAAKNADKLWSLPITPATGQMASAIDQEFDLVVHNKKSPAEAAQAINDAVQPEIDSTLPK